MLNPQRFVAETTLWLSAVVIEELYAGGGERERLMVKKMEQDFNRIRRVLVPNLNDWVETGTLLARLAAKYHYELLGRGRLTNDALIATSAGRCGVRVMTANRRDFGKLAEFRSFQWEVMNV